MAFSFDAGIQDPTKPIISASANPTAPRSAILGQNVPKYLSGSATVFGRNLDGSIDSQDNGIGAWGANTRDPSLVGVSLPISLLKAKYGDTSAAKGQMVEVINPKTGSRIVAPIVDKGPAAWTGNAIDLTYGAAKQLNASGKDAMQFRFMDGDTPDWNPNAPDSPVFHAAKAAQTSAGSGDSGGQQREAQKVLNPDGFLSSGGVSYTASATPTDWSVLGRAVAPNTPNPAAQQTAAQNLALIAANAENQSKQNNPATSAIDNALRFFRPTGSLGG